MNIDIDENIAKVLQHMNEIKSELLRLEGSLRTLQNIKEMGVKKIDINNESVVESKEIVDGSIQG
jgi:hypothetical protein